MTIRYVVYGTYARCWWHDAWWGMTHGGEPYSVTMDPWTT
jgi:hypothetical protein